MATVVDVVVGGGGGTVVVVDVVVVELDLGTTVVVTALSGCDPVVQPARISTTQTPPVAKNRRIRRSYFFHLRSHRADPDRTNLRQAVSGARIARR